VSSESSCAVRLARHSQNAWARHVECVESSRVESSQVEFELMAVPVPPTLANDVMSLTLMALVNMVKIQAFDPSLILSFYDICSLVILCRCCY